MQFHNLEVETTISARSEMVVFLFPETLQFPQFGSDNILGSSEKSRRFQVLETPKITPKPIRYRPTKYRKIHQERRKALCRECLKK